MKIEKAAKEGNNLIVTIEAFNHWINPDDIRLSPNEKYPSLENMPLCKEFSRICNENHCYLVVGLYNTISEKMYNSAVLFDRQGKIAGVHNKVHLPAGEEKHITPGNTFEVFETDFGKIGMLVCWDMQYPEAARILSLKNADIIACPTWGWENIYGLCRAYENSVTVVAAMGLPYGIPLWDFCDPSCIVDNMGKIVVQAGREKTEIISAEIDILVPPTPQYGSGEITGCNSMRIIRRSQRRPDCYQEILLT